jgi:hypothetical protein
MPSKTTTELVETLSELETKLRQFDTEARKLGEIRGEFKAAVAGFHAAGRDLQSLASALREGAATMRDLDMAATLKRLAEIETRLDERSKKLEAVIDREIAELGDSLKHQVSKEMSALPGQIGPTVASAFESQFEATNTALTSMSSDTAARHAEILQAVRAGLEQQSKESAARSDSISQQLSRIDMTLRETSQNQNSLLMKSFADLDARTASSMKSLEAEVATNARRGRSVAIVAVFVSLLAAAAATIGIFI